MAEPLVQILVALAVGVLVLVTFLRAWATRDLEAQIRVLEGQVVAWQANHDHQVASMDRRLLDLEECAARAEDESRMVSLQMERIAETLRHRVEQLTRHSQMASCGDGGRAGGDRGPGSEVSAGGTDEAADRTHDREAVLTAGGGW